MQDFNYLATNAMETTLELSCAKLPDPKEMPQYWADNRQALFAYLWRAHAGIKGVVVDARTGEPVEGALVWVRNGTQTIPHPVSTWSDGTYHRLLPAGHYELVVSARGYAPAAQAVNVTNATPDSAHVVHFSLIQEDAVDETVAEVAEALGASADEDVEQVEPQQLEEEEEAQLDQRPPQSM